MHANIQSDTPDCLTPRTAISKPLIAWTIPAGDPKFRVRSAAPFPQMWAENGSENQLGKTTVGKGATSFKETVFNIQNQAYFKFRTEF